MQKRALRLLLAAVVCLGMFSAMNAWGQAVVPVTISTVADSTLSIPGGTGTFETFNPNLAFFLPNPIISDGIVAFWGGGSGGQQGIYVVFPPSPIFPPSPQKIADLNTLIPSGIGDFLSFPPTPAISGTNVAFIGNGSSQQGVYVGFPPTPTFPPQPLKIADLNTAIPSGTGNFIAFGPTAAISGTNVVFYGEGTSQKGIYSCFPPNPCAPFADLNTTFPGTTDKFAAFFQAPAISGTNVAFSGFGSSTTALESGVYACFPPNPCTPVADNTTAVPGAGSNVEFFSFPNVSLDGTTVAFMAFLTDTVNPGKNLFPALYLGSPGVPPTLVADTSTAVPGGSGSFTGFGNVAIDPNNVVFGGFSSNNSVKGIYGRIGGSLIKIIADGDTLAGKTVSDVNLGSGGFSGNQVVFEVEFTDGSQSVSAGTFNNFIRCPQSQGFWKNHRSQWPVSTLVLGNQNYSQSQLLALLGTSSTSDASLVLARQLIAAKLNIANFSNPAPANAAIADGDNLLVAFVGKLPYNVKDSSTIGTRMVSDSDTLQNYNADQLTPGCTP